MGLICADTTFLIDLNRQAGRGAGPVHRFLGEHLTDEFALSVTALGELAAGFNVLANETFMAVQSKFQILSADESDAWHHREILRHLEERGELIGANDLWIAAAALRNQAALVSRNAGEFRRVPGLEDLTC